VRTAMTATTCWKSKNDVGVAPQSGLELSCFEMEQNIDPALAAALPAPPLVTSVAKTGAAAAAAPMLKPAVSHHEQAHCVSRRHACNSSRRGSSGDATIERKHSRRPTSTTCMTTITSSATTIESATAIDYHPAPTCWASIAARALGQQQHFFLQEQPCIDADADGLAGSPAQLHSFSVDSPLQHAAQLTDGAGMLEQARALYEVQRAQQLALQRQQLLQLFSGARPAEEAPEQLRVTSAPCLGSFKAQAKLGSSTGAARCGQLEKLHRLLLQQQHHAEAAEEEEEEPARLGGAIVEVDRRNTSRAAHVTGKRATPPVHDAQQPSDGAPAAKVLRRACSDVALIAAVLASTAKAAPPCTGGGLLLSCVSDEMQETLLSTTPSLASMRA
jgi:hypothetical protein